MDTQTYNDKIAALMKEWMESYNGNFHSFTKDGIIDPDKWYKLPDGKRILVILKESYNKDKEITVSDIGKWIRGEKCCDDCQRRKDCNNSNEKCQNCPVSGKSYNAVAQWAYAIIEDKWDLAGIKTELAKISDDDKEPHKKKRIDYLRKIAIVNIKKVDGTSGSNNGTISDYAKQDKKYLIRQIKLIAPDIIICGGTYNAVHELYPELPLKSVLSDKPARINGIPVIVCKHPNRNSQKEMLACIQKAYQNINNI